MDDRQQSENEYLDEVYSDMENEHVVTFTISCPGNELADKIRNDIEDYLLNKSGIQFVSTVKPIAVYLQDEEADNGNA
jgi:hypothetical protein